jgi:hypothetical protein
MSRWWLKGNSLMKLFVFSNAYTARVLLLCCKYIVASHNTEIILLSEIGISTDSSKNNINFSVQVYNTLHQCIEACTDILIIQNDSIPKSKIDLTMSLASSYNKRCLKVEGFKQTQKTIKDEMNLSQNFKDKPTILIVSYNEPVQLSCWEIAINKLLKNNGLHVYQEVSDELTDILNWFALCNTSHKEFLCDIFVPAENCDVVLKSIQHTPNTSDEMVKVLYRLKPDVIIIAINSNYYNYDEIRNIYKYKHGRIIDFFAKSELLEITKDENRRQVLTFNFTQTYEEDDSIINLSNPVLMDLLTKAIIPKIKLPNGVIII